MNSSKLFDQNTFYKAFLKDIHHAKHRVIIESPFITQKRGTKKGQPSKKASRSGKDLQVLG